MCIRDSPTPIFRGVTKRFKQECGPRASWQRDTSSSSSSSSDEDESVKPLWVQCDHRSCQKWRKVPPGTKIDMEEWVWIPVLPSFTCTLTLSLPLTHTHTNRNWYCCMHPDPTYQSCDTPQEKCQKPRKRGFTFSRLTAGQLIWARLIGFPPLVSAV